MLILIKNEMILFEIILTTKNRFWIFRKDDLSLKITKKNKFLLDALSLCFLLVSSKSIEKYNPLWLWDIIGL